MFEINCPVEEYHHRATETVDKLTQVMACHPTNCTVSGSGICGSMRSSCCRSQTEG